MTRDLRRNFIQEQERRFAVNAHLYHVERCLENKNWSELEKITKEDLEKLESRKRLPDDNVLRIKRGTLDLLRKALSEQEKWAELYALNIHYPCPSGKRYANPKSREALDALARRCSKLAEAKHWKELSMESSRLLEYLGDSGDKKLHAYKIGHKTLVIALSHLNDPDALLTARKAECNFLTQHYPEAPIRSDQSLCRALVKFEKWAELEIEAERLRQYAQESGQRKKMNEANIWLSQAYYNQGKWEQLEIFSLLRIERESHEIDDDHLAHNYFHIAKARAEQNKMIPAYEAMVSLSQLHHHKVPYFLYDLKKCYGLQVKYTLKTQQQLSNDVQER